MAAIDDARALLESAGYVVLKAKSYHQAQQKLAIAKAQVEWAEHDVQSARNWAENCLARERQLSDRCSYLYGLSVSLGATVDQLRGT